MLKLYILHTYIYTYITKYGKITTNYLLLTYIHISIYIYIHIYKYIYDMHI